MIKSRLIIMLAVLTLGLVQCKISNLEDPVTDIKPPTKEINALNIPEGFNFSTSKMVNIEINGEFSKKGSDGMVKYSIYLYNEKYTETITVDEATGLLSSQGVQHTINNSGKYKLTSIVTNSSKSIELEIPTYIEKLLIVKDDYGSISSQIVPVSSFGKKSSVTATFSNQINPTGFDDAYCELGRNQFTFNKDGTKTILTSFPEEINGVAVLSAGVAIDSRNNIKYNVNNYAPYQIIKSTIGQDDYTIIGNGIGFKTSSLGFNDHDKALYSIEVVPGSQNVYLHRIMPFLGSVDKKWLLTIDIFGTPYTTGTVGDLSVCNDGDIMFSTIDGIYEVQRVDVALDELQIGLYANSGVGQNQITGMATNSSNDLVINNNTEGSVGILDYEGDNPGEYTTVFDSGEFLSDMAIYRSQLANFTDEDNDGIADYYDEYPLNPELAFNQYCPSIYGNFTMMTEDLWPSKGDYDFNDLVIKYKSKRELNAERLVVNRLMDVTVLHVGGSYKNGIGLNWFTAPSNVETYTNNYQLTEGIIETLPNGLEANQSNAILIIFDNARKVTIGEKIQSVTHFSTPIECIDGGGNMFMFINGDRSRELSFMNKTPTDLAGTQWFNIGHDVTNVSEGITYQGATKLPWMIRLTDDIDFIPNEKINITEAFTKFKQWAETGGTEYSDWYLNETGYRNLENMSRME